jgi:hypothetical protein
MPVHRDGLGGAESRALTFTSAANTTGQTTVLTELGDEQEFLVEEVYVKIPDQAKTNVSVQVFAGAKPIAPVDNPLRLSGEYVGLAAHELLSAGDKLVADHSNASGSDRSVTVIVAGLTPG